MPAAPSKALNVAVVGAGPAGLFFARLLARRAPRHRISIFEQNPKGATYGFGVTLAGAARQRLRQADEEAIDRLAESMVFNSEQAIDLDGERVHLRYASSGGAIARLELLEVLEDLCRKLGLEVRHGHRIVLPEDLDGFDLVVGADGANSVIRNQFSEEFGVRTRVLDNRYAWYGVARALRPNGLSFRHWNGGRFIGHYYAYTGEMSTFVAECDGQTWERHLASLSDVQRRQMMEEIFADELQGEPLVENKSVWRRFEATTTTRWSHGNAVLIGDALRVAHFSIGSGTRLAMDDALALNDALAEAGEDVSAALQLFVCKRKPNRDVFTDATVRSFEWYEDIATAMEKPVVEFTHAFLTRTGRLDDDRLREYVPEFYRDHIAPSFAHPQDKPA